MFYQTHVFCCTNKRAEGHERGSCAQKGSEQLRNYMKTRAKELGLPGTRINSSGCLDRCELGPVVVVYPEGIWYRCETKQDIDELLAGLQAGRTPERLRLSDSQK